MLPKEGRQNTGRHAPLQAEFLNKLNNVQFVFVSFLDFLYQSNPVGIFRADGNP